jgi:hypothetical protein
MIMKRFAVILFIVCTLALPGWSAESPVALADGETLKYRVRWGLFAGAGEIVVKARETQTAGLPQINITTHTSTRGFVRSLYVFDGDGECIFDARDGRLLAIKSSSASSKKSTRTMAVFDHDRQKVQYVDYIRPERNAELPIPDGNAMDLITCLIQTRNWDMKPGDKSPATVMFDREFYEIMVHAEGYERVRTALGEFNTLVLVPTMEKDPKGIFKRGGRVRVWISQDQLRLPVKFEVSMKVGTGVAMLTEYIPPVEGAQVAAANRHEDSRP